MRWERQLHKDAIDTIVGVEPLDQRDQFGLSGIGGQQMFKTRHSGFDRGLLLGADIDLARGIAADQNYCETGSTPGRCLKS